MAGIMIYHITTRQEWDIAQSAGEYSAPSLQSEGFIHCSTVNQIVDVANAFYRDVPNLILLCIDETKLSFTLKWEAPVHPQGHDPSTIDEQQLFPHVYGTINLDAVMKIVDMLKNNDGLYRLPDDID
jgi:uncharacterized protein (DUF952 family)